MDLSNILNNSKSNNITRDQLISLLDELQNIAENSKDPSEVISAIDQMQSTLKSTHSHTK